MYPVYHGCVLEQKRGVQPFYDILNVNNGDTEIEKKRNILQLNNLLNKLKNEKETIEHLLWFILQYEQAQVFWATFERRWCTVHLAQ